MKAVSVSLVADSIGYLSKLCEVTTLDWMCINYFQGAGNSPME